MWPRTRLVVASTSAVAFVLLTALVALGLTRSVDVALRDAFRPDDVWGTLQVRVDVVVEGLKPVRTVAGFAALVVVLALVRRSWVPVWRAASLLVLAAVPALVVKVALARTDPHHELSSTGSYPSGHTLVLLVCLGGALLLVRRAPAWWEWLLVALVDAVMALSLLAQAAHWFTDVLAGALLGVAVLASVPAGVLAPPRGRPPATPGSDAARPHSVGGRPSR
ncbi:MAG: phosphatase PAP2 family protein [Nocardioides sp.]|nr:phosphatase PAP2 family protein [Nocardioides sp.]